MESRMSYSRVTYLTVEHIDGEDFDHWKFNTFEDAIEWLKDYPTQTHNWILSGEPVSMPESEYTPLEVEKKEPKIWEWKPEQIPEKDYNEPDFQRMTLPIEVNVTVVEEDNGSFSAWVEGIPVYAHADTADWAVSKLHEALKAHKLEVDKLKKEN